MSDYQKPAYEIAIDEFTEADSKYLQIEEYFLSGTVLRDLILDGAPVERAIEEFKLVIEEMKKLLEDRNIKLQNAKNCFRAAVQLGPSQWRGPEGKSTTITYGPFSVSSNTRRSLDGQSLLNLATKKGVLNELMSLKTIDKDGKPSTLIRTRLDIDYEGVLGWLRSHNLDDVVDGSYDEREGTPAVKGPKSLAFFGEKKKDE